MEDLPLRVIRSRRRTYSIEMDESGITIRVPLWMDRNHVEEILQKHAGWIEKHAKVIYRRRKERASFGLEGGNLMYLGRAYPIVRSSSLRSITFDGEKFLLPHGNSDRMRKLLVRWFKEQARRIILPRVRHFSRITGLDYRGVRITSAMKRWGSCTAKKNLNFSYRLVMAPLHVIDYVVVHELIHTKIPGHGRDFYERVQEILPDFREREKWLRENAHLMFI